ncbi:hypothetical protein RFI_32536 [Reticulomyxa filosa]|uniref:WD-40 repeat protein n=1 Tax=Reticulomyxa filosa TaxID=46433 RepID=X6LVZ6_RETFI|nr:hypothetical protein RFI_32536 [Reticulomyxa filosa]|eukprot:ETO04860.1 hypothetical protein RFI_32536 [Reticulomyxa filosa]
MFFNKNLLQICFHHNKLKCIYLVINIIIIVIIVLLLLQTLTYFIINACSFISKDSSILKGCRVSIIHVISQFKCFLISKKEIQTLIQYWIRTLTIKIGWVYDFDKLVVNYIMYFILFYYLMTIAILKHLFSVIVIITIHTGNKFHPSTKLLKIFTGHIRHALIVFLKFKSLNVFNGHRDCAECVDISPLQNNNNKSNKIGGDGYTICSGSFDQTIRIWNSETTKQLMI